MIAFPYWAIGHEAPIADAGNCVARASNLGLRLLHGELARYWSDVRAERNNLLSVVYFSGFSLVFGPGRIWWGWGRASSPCGLPRSSRCRTDR
jgi:hypothetical protein